MICALGRTSHSTRNTARSASWAARTARRPRRSRRSQSRYCGEGIATAACSETASTFDMDFKLLPQRAEIGIKLRRVAGGERRRPRAPCRRKADRVVAFDPARPPRQHDDALGHADRLANVVGDENRGLALAP